MTLSLRQELEFRGFLNQHTSEDFFDDFDKGGHAFYIGADPSASSLTIGNFVWLLFAMQFLKRGNKMYFIIGGATGMIGDPGGKNSERTFLDQDTLKKNIDSIKTQISGILNHFSVLLGKKLDFEIIDNYEFYKDFLFIDFLRDVGKYMTVNQMIHRDTVKKRIFEPDQSISYTEFSYMLMQGYDYLKLNEKYNVTLQLGASDQRGNIITGVDFIRRKNGKEVHAATCPLLVDGTGKKFGKSEGNALRLDPTLTSPFKLFQYFMNSADEDIQRYLKVCTFLSPSEIDEIVRNHNIDTSKRFGQTALAAEIVKMIYGQKTMDLVKNISSVLFSSDGLSILSGFDNDSLMMLYEETGGSILSNIDATFIDILVESGHCESRGDAKKAIESGSVSINDRKILDINEKLLDSDFLSNKVAILRKGKKNIKTLLIR